MPTLQRAIEIAVAAHAGQVDKEGLPYITHPLRLMNDVDGEAAQIVAVLHDVVEDTAVTIEQLSAEGFAPEVVSALTLVTHAKDQPYVDYVVRIKTDPIARQVKLADLRDNARLERTLLRPSHAARDFARMHRYILSYRFLTDRLTETEFRRLMDAFGAMPA